MRRSFSQLHPSRRRGKSDAADPICDGGAGYGAGDRLGPVPVDARLFNCAAVCQRGILLGLVPKTHLPAYSEFYEARHFSPAGEQPLPVTFAGQRPV